MAFRTSLLAVALGLLASSVDAQTSVMDEATLLVTRNGASVGRESFHVLRSPGPGGQVFLATGQSAIGERRATTRLGIDSAGVPVMYEADVSARGVSGDRVRGRGRPGRFSVLVQTSSGESARDYRLENGALLMDTEIFHHYSFVPLVASHERVTVIEPREAKQVTYRLADRGTETITVGRRSLKARHYALVAETGASRDVWIDSAGRLLRVSIPEEGLIATREEAAR